MTDLIVKYESIARNENCNVEIASAKMLSTFKGGGSACVFIPEDVKSFVRIYELLATDGYNPYVLGAGSNTVIADGIISTPIIFTKRLNKLEYSCGLLSAECGVRISAVTQTFRQYGYGGFEFLCGVPATVGGVIKMNASAFLTQTADYVQEITVLSGNFGKYCVKTLYPHEINFGYRKGSDSIILSAVLRADTSVNVEKSKALAHKYLDARKAKQPRLPSCGSVFKNGIEPAGKLIDGCGLKGKTVGGAQISDVHANFIVNIGGATTSDFMSLVELCEKCVYDKYGIILEREFVYLE